MEWLEQRLETGQNETIVIGAKKDLPKSGKHVLAKITIPGKTMALKHEVVYHNGDNWGPADVFKYGGKVVGWKYIEEDL